MCGLAAVLAGQPGGEEGLQGGRQRCHEPSLTGRRCGSSDAFGGGGEQFGGAGQIPVGVAGFAVPKPGGQQRQDRGGVGAAGVGVEHGARREGVSQVVLVPTSAQA